MPAATPLRRTKIVCTVGPACRDVETLTAMIRAGANVFRINGAHADEAAIPEWVERLRAAGEAADRTVGTWVDLPGTKIRLGGLAGNGSVGLVAGAELDLDGGAEPGDATRLPVRSFPYFADVPAGGMVLLGEGQIRLRVLRGEEGRLRVRVLEGGEASAGMGLHFPGVTIPTAVPTERDVELLRAAVTAGVDMVSQSFVRSADDMSRLRERLQELGAKRLLAIAKIERVEAIEALDRILRHADGAVVARGDLGLDAGPENVPSLQRRILDAARRRGCPAAVATEMLDSMTRSSRPTRAEASDVAGAVFEGADAVMLSAETAIGAHPVLVVETMARILESAEADPTAPYAGHDRLAPPARHAGRPDQHVVRAAVSLARETEAGALVVFTRTGVSAVRMSKERPRAPIHAFAPTDAVCRQLTLAWGVHAKRLPRAEGTDAVVGEVVERLRATAALGPGDRAVLVMGGAKDPAGATTLIKLVTV
ncbi:MAG: pyruvate kinase [Planctomycetota bacterium]|jgi:pyruvate kinase